MPEETKEQVEIRAMQTADYPGVYRLWKSIRGFGIRAVDDTEEGIRAFLDRNPGLSAVAVSGDGEIIGTILCGHDGRTGSFYHVCVREAYRGQGICARMTAYCTDGLRRAGISRITLIAFVSNRVGNAYWLKRGWKKREDCNQYLLELNRDNITVFNE